MVDIMLVLDAKWLVNGIILLLVSVSRPPGGGIRVASLS